MVARKMKAFFFFSIVLIFLLFAGCSLPAQQKKGSFEIQGSEQKGSGAGTAESQNALPEDIGISAPGKIVPVFECDKTPAKKVLGASAYYEGPLIDAHLHMPSPFSLPDFLMKEFPYDSFPVLERDVLSDEIICQMDKYGIKKVVGFYPSLESMLTPALYSIKPVQEKHGERISAFILPAPVGKPLYSPEKLDEIFSSNPELFDGYGEIASYYPVFEGTSLDDPEFLETYKIVAKHKKVIMIHPTIENIPFLEKIIAQNPDIIFYLHGGGQEDELMRMLNNPQSHEMVFSLVEKYDNVYYSFEGLYNIYHFSSSEEYSKFFREKFDLLLQKHLERFKAPIEANPDKFMWGTDRLETWHFDDETTALLVEAGRAFIAGLSPEVQEKFAYKNAEKMLAGN